MRKSLASIIAFAAALSFAPALAVAFMSSPAGPVLSVDESEFHSGSSLPPCGDFCREGTDLGGGSGTIRG